MKVFLLFLSILSFQNMYACSCEIPPSLCEYAKVISNSDKGIIFIGEYVQEEVVDFGQVAYQYKVEKLIRGSVVTDEAPLMNNPSYANTDSTVWLLGGESSLCHWKMSGRSLFVTEYYSGYYPNICTNSYFQIDDQNIIKGAIWERETYEDLDVTHLEEVITGTCITSADDDFTTLEKEVNIYPNPVDDLLNIYLDSYNVTSIKYELRTTLGRIISYGLLEDNETTISLTSLTAGVYLITIVDRNLRYTTRLVKT